MGESYVATMEQLIASFNRAVSISTSTPIQLVLEDGGVVTYSPISRGTVIGEVYGTPAYIWELDHSDYIIIDQDYVLDTSTLPSPRSILTMVREENNTHNMGNCTINTVTFAEGHRFFMQATSDIMPGSELVYYILT